MGFFNNRDAIKFLIMTVMMLLIGSIGRELTGWSPCKQRKPFFYFGHFIVKNLTV